MEIIPGARFGKLRVIEKADNYRWRCICDCGNESFPTGHNLPKTKLCGRCGKNVYRDCDDGCSVAVTTPNGYVFYIDKADEELVKKHKWYVCVDKRGYTNICTARNISLYHYLLNFPKGVEIDHIDFDRLNNRRANLRICTHQQNQMNQPLQKNNTSGVSGVSFYRARNKYRARIKISQLDIHLGYYETFQEAVQARNVGMECMFGEYGRYNDVPAAPTWIRTKVIEKCKRFAELSVCRAFLLSQSEEC